MSQEEAHFSMQSVHTSSRQGISSRGATAARESLCVCAVRVPTQAPSTAARVLLSPSFVVRPSLLPRLSPHTLAPSSPARSERLTDSKLPTQTAVACLSISGRRHGATGHSWCQTSRSRTPEPTRASSRESAGTGHPASWLESRCKSRRCWSRRASCCHPR